MGFTVCQEPRHTRRRRSWAQVSQLIAGRITCRCRRAPPGHRRSGHRRSGHRRSGYRRSGHRRSGHRHRLPGVSSRSKLVKKWSKVARRAPCGARTSPASVHDRGRRSPTACTEPTRCPTVLEPDVQLVDRCQRADVRASVRQLAEVVADRDEQDLLRLVLLHQLEVDADCRGRGGRRRDRPPRAGTWTRAGPSAGPSCRCLVVVSAVRARRRSSRVRRSMRFQNQNEPPVRTHPTRPSITQCSPR